MKDDSHPDFAPREYDYRSIYTTWNVSIECVKQKNNDAANMLQLWSYLDNKDIWYSLFNNKQNRNLELWYSHLPRWFNRVMGNEVDFRRAVRILLSYSLIEAKEDSDAFAMHPVVHDWCRETIDDAGERQYLMLLAITVVGFAVPQRTERRYWEIELRLLPHTNRCIALLDNLVMKNQPSGDLLDLIVAVLGLGGLCCNQSKLAEAEAMFQWALEIKKHSKAVDLDPYLTAWIHVSLGGLYSEQWKLDEAEATFQRALPGFEESSGSDTKETMMVIDALGTVYSRQEKLAEAEALCKRALAWRTDTLGPDHLVTMDTVSNLAIIYEHQGKLAEAESLNKQVLVLWENELGPEHPLTLDTVHNLGLCYQDQKKFVEAEIHFKRALSGREKILGPEHTATLHACFDLGKALSAQEKFVEAEIQSKRALSGYKNNKHYGGTMWAAVELSKIYKKQGRLVEAEAMLRPLSAEFEAALGPDHVLTLKVCFEIALILMDQDDERNVEAEAMFQRALSGFKKVLGMDHISTLNLIYNHHIATLNTVYNLGLVLKRQKKLHEAEDMFQSAFSGSKKMLGPDHPNLKAAAERLREIYEEQGRHEEAEAILQSVS